MFTRTNVANAVALVTLSLTPVSFAFVGVNKEVIKETEVIDVVDIRGSLITLNVKR